MLRAKFVISCILLLVTTRTFAAAPPAPADATIYLEADQVDIDDKQGISIYVGNVKLTRDAMTITADKMTVYRDKQDLKKVIAVGAPVRLHQAASATSKETTGEGLRMEYDAQSGEVLLNDNAKLHQENNEFTGSFVRYNVNNETVKAGKGATAGERVHVVIHPKETPKPPVP
jgi:lipopolysaccharide export system protein LptA